MAGLLKFAKYAFPPNTLQYCGPDDVGMLFDLISEEQPGKDMKNLLLRFSGAMPYLKLIAENSGIKDIFDERIVEAYWLGNNLLKNIETEDIYLHIKERFERNMTTNDWRWLIGKSIPKAKPFHGFHVFDIYRRAGLSRSGSKENVLETMDKCRIAWGKVESVNLSVGDKKNPSFGFVLVKYRPLVFEEKKILLGKEVLRKAFITDTAIKPGDDVSLHWEYICDKITQRQKNNLIYWTNYHLALANETI